MKALSLLVQKLWPRLSFFKSRSKVKVKVKKSKKICIDRKVLSQGIHLCNIGSKVMVKVKFTLDRRTDRWTDRQGDSYIPPKLCMWGI